MCANIAQSDFARLSQGRQRERCMVVKEHGVGRREGDKKTSAEIAGGTRAVFTHDSDERINEFTSVPFHQFRLSTEHDKNDLEFRMNGVTSQAKSPESSMCTDAPGEAVNTPRAQCTVHTLLCHTER